MKHLKILLYLVYASWLYSHLCAAVEIFCNNNAKICILCFTLSFFVTNIVSMVIQTMISDTKNGRDAVNACSTVCVYILVSTLR